MRNLILITLLFISSISASFAQIHEPVKWSMDHQHVSGNEFNLIYTATIEDGWSVYSQYLESDDGPVRTSFDFEAGSHFALKGKNEESGSRKEAFDKFFEMNVIKFTKTAIFTQKVTVSDYSKPIEGYFTFMTCDHSKCLPPTDVDFSFTLKPVAKSGATTTEKPKTTPAKDVKPVEEVAKKTNVEKTTKKVDQLKAASDKAQDKVFGKKDKTTAKAETKKATKKEKAIAAAPATAKKNTAKKSKILEPVKWTIRSKKIGNNEYDLILTAKIEDGWYMYSQYLESDEGPLPTLFYWDEKDTNLELVGKSKEESPKVLKAYDKMFEMNLTKFKKSATFTQRVKVKNPSKSVQAEIEFQTCDATKCLPPTAVPFLFRANKMATFIGSENVKDALRAGAGAITNAGAGASGANGFASKINGNVIDQSVAVIQQTYETPIGNCGEEDNAKGQNLFVTFFLGFVGGLLALLTPCVFPMIPLTVSYFTKGSTNRATGIKNGLIYGASIIFIYVLIGLLITGVFGADALNALSTNWIANVFFFIIFIVFAFSFFGFFEITLPSSWTTKSDAMADKGGLIGTFFMAFTLALVSFSCTGPIIGTALVESATNPMGPFIVMLGFSSALALPFGLFAAFPAWLNSLPQSGGWMNSVKVVLGFLELALALKFLSVADMTMHWGILGYEIFMGLWVLIFGAMTVYLFGYIKFPHDSPVTKLSIPRKIFALGSLALTFSLASGFMLNEKTKVYDSLPLMSGLAPPAHYNYALPKLKVDPEIKKEFPSFTKCANNLDCFKDYYEGVAYAKKVKLPILLDFTGYGCVNCRKTEEHIWIKDDVWTTIKKDFVLISLYVDDKNKLDDVLISKQRDKKLRTIGNKWADFQIVNFEQNSQPLYVLMNADEEVLAKPRGYNPDAEKYFEFLNCGLNFYNQSKATGMK